MIKNSKKTIYRYKSFLFNGMYLCGETVCGKDCEICNQIFKEVE